MKNIINFCTLHYKITSGPHQLIENKFGDICDGTIFEEHPIFSHNKQAIQIVAYFDEMETANALGAKAAKNNKLGTVNFRNICILLGV